MAAFRTLDRPFFTLEYREGVFVRRLPPGAEDLGGGKFRYGGAALALPEPDLSDPEHALALPRIGGKPLLSLLRRGDHPLIAAGPRLAPPEERIMELALDGPVPAGGPGGGPLRLVLRQAGTEEWLPLEGLPSHRFRGGRVCEIIGEADLALLAGSFGIGGGGDRLVLRGEEIPRFAGDHARLVYRFGEPALRRLLSEEAVFIPAAELSLILSVRTGPGRDAGRDGGGAGRGGVRAVPVLKCGGRRYPALEVSRLMDRAFVLLEDRWARREDLEHAGLLPLGRYAGGAPIEPVRPEAAELIRRGGPRFDHRFSGLEWDEGLWKSRGGREEIFVSHLEFLRTMGLSGGVRLSPHRDQGQALLAWFGECAGKPGAGGITVLMEKRYHDLYFAPLLPPPAPEILFYEDLREGAGPRKAGTAGGVLVLVEPEEALFDEGRDRADEVLLSAIKSREPALLLGIFSDTWRFLNDPGWSGIRALFGLRAARTAAGDDTARYLFRDAAAALPLPEAHPFPPPAILRPPARGGDRAAGGGDRAPFFCAVEERFRRLPTGDLLSELAQFDTAGGPAPFVPPGPGAAYFDRMNDGERAYFLYWRSAFRTGTALPAAEAYIRLYLRELCLFTGKEAAPRRPEPPGGGAASPGGGPEKNFRELLRLWRTYRGAFPRLDGDLPRWLFDYAALYGIEDRALPLLFPFVHDGPFPPLTDRYLYHTFIEENNGIGFADLQALIGETVAGSVFFSPGDAASEASPALAPLLAKDYAAVINGVDRFLRERCRMKLFEFFYPPAACRERRRAFEGLSLMGDSFYTDGGARFTLHKPLTAFLDGLFRYTEYRFKLRTGYEKPRQVPPLETVWRDIADAVLDGRGGQAGQVHGASAVPPGAPLQLSFSFVDRLREESDQVRDLLHSESADEAPAPQTQRNPAALERPREKTALPAPGGGTAPANSVAHANSMAAFVAGLDPVAAAALRLIASGEGREALDALAREHGAMTELIIDGVNEQFLDAFGDLLVETTDDAPRIAGEYAEMMKSVNDL